MKRITQLSIILLFSIASMAQTQEGEKVVSVKMGFSATGALIKGIGNSSDLDLDSIGTGDVSVSGLPALSASFDYGFSENFSLGALISYQAFSGSVRDYKFSNEDSFKVEDFNFNLKRIYLGIEPKLHWGGSNEKIDLYSGLRIGYILWVNNIETTDNNFDLFDRFNVGRPSVALVPLGGNIYFNEDTGANFEIAIGAPYLFSLGVQHKF
mgnify:CR=1 FL=1